ncbi:MAG TPA: hypothetical protein VGJ73_19435 [Verrucomicrobiae bacterium]
MHLLVFEIFARTITNLSPAAILKALDLESPSLERYSDNYRLFLPADAYSIFCFRQFIRSTKLGGNMPPCKSLPPGHVTFYRQTVERLIEANALAKSTLEQFDLLFPFPGQR